MILLTLKSELWQSTIGNKQIKGEVLDLTYNSRNCGYHLDE